LAASFAAVRVRIADGPPQRIHDKGMQHMPGEEVLARRRASLRLSGGSRMSVKLISNCYGK
jgi:hypothetical protein